MHKSLYSLVLNEIAMTNAIRQDRRTQVIFHTLGLSCIGGAIFLQTLVFTDILTNGYFMAVEHNLAILSFEVLLTAFSFMYFIYIYQRFVRSIR
jgi:hypothetical protein